MEFGEQEEDEAASNVGGKRGLGPEGNVMAAASRGAVSHEEINKMKRRELVTALATWRTMKEMRKVLGAICDTTRVDKKFKVGVNTLIAVKGYQDATREHPQTHGLGSMHLQIVMPFLKSVVGYIKGVMKPTDGERMFVFAAEVEAWPAGSDDVTRCHAIMTHLFAKESYDQKSVIFDAVYAPTTHAQNVRESVAVALKHMGGERCIGPPPPSDEERALRTQIAELKEELNIDPKGKGKGKGKKH
jgi:hypothetical protein